MATVLTHLSLLLLSAESQCYIVVAAAHLDLAASRRSTGIPHNRAAVAVVARHNKFATLEWVTENVAEVVPDLGTVKVEGKVGLGGTGPKTVGGDRDLESAPSSDGVAGKLLAVGPTAGLEARRVADLAADRPEGNVLGAQVDDTCRAERRD